MEKHRVLIIGCGNIAGRFDAARPADALPLTHAGAFAGDPRFALAACVDPDRERRSEFQQRWRISQSGSDVEELKAVQGAFDVISICSPTQWHEAHLSAALALRPRLIFCEKPVATSAEATARLVTACESAGVKLAVNYTRRWAPDVIRLARDLRDGRWGTVRSATGLYTKGVVHNGGHMIDLLRLLLGDLRLTAAGRPSFDHWPTDPSVPAMLESMDGAPVHLTIGDARDFAVFELTLVAEKGVIEMRDGGRAWFTRRVTDSDTFAGYRTLAGPEASPAEYDAAMRAAVANIADAMAGDAPLASDGANALAAQRLCETILSAATAAPES